MGTAGAGWSIGRRLQKWPGVVPQVNQMLGNGPIGEVGRGPNAGNWSNLGLVDPQDRLASDAAAAQGLHRTAKVSPADFEADLRSQLTFGHQSGHEGEVPSERPNVGRVNEEALDPSAGATAKVGEPEPRRFPGNGAKERDPPTWRQCMHRPLQRAAADALHDKVERAAEILVSNDCPGRSQAFQPLASIGAPHGCRHPGAGDSSELDSEPADTAACAGDQYIAAQQITSEA